MLGGGGPQLLASVPAVVAPVTRHLPPRLAGRARYDGPSLARVDLRRDAGGGGAGPV
eukprot:COSAG01_NODE_229_length_21089_cov_575.019194_14_plen_57_part_00